METKKTYNNQILRISGNISNAYTSLESKGATIPAEKTSDNLPTTINSLVGAIPTFYPDTGILKIVTVKPSQGE